MAKARERWRVKPGSPVDLSSTDPASTAGAPGGKEKTEATFPDLQARLAELQERLWAEHKQSLLVVLQAIDGGGKDGTVRHVFRGLNPAGCRVVSFKVPTEEERAHDFLWRVHPHAPGDGEVVVFNRSHYEDVLVVRVHSIVPETVWRPRYEQIVNFESLLAAGGTRIVKFFLHISKDEQARRFRDRLADPSKQWKFRAGDLEEREHWDGYREAFEEALSRTSTKAAPWYVVPANHKWYRNWVVYRVLLDALEDMDPQYPPPEEGLDRVEIV